MTEQELLNARKAIWKLAQMGGKHTELLMQYIGLFAENGERLSFERVHVLLHEVSEVWISSSCELTDFVTATSGLLQQHMEGKLKTPLQNHHLLLDALDVVKQFDDDEPSEEQFAEVAQYLPTPAPVAPPKSPDPPPYHKPTAEQKQKRHEQAQDLMKMLEAKLNSRPIINPNS